MLKRVVVGSVLEREESVFEIVIERESVCVLKRVVEGSV